MQQSHQDADWSLKMLRCCLVLSVARMLPSPQSSRLLFSHLSGSAAFLLPGNVPPSTLLRAQSLLMFHGKWKVITPQAPKHSNSTQLFLRLEIR